MKYVPGMRKAFGSVKKCPKCNGTKFDRFWRPKDKDRRIVDGGYQEHLRVQCYACGFYDFEETADAHAK